LCRRTFDTTPRRGFCEFQWRPVSAMVLLEWNYRNMKLEGEGKGARPIKPGG